MPRPHVELSSEAQAVTRRYAMRDAQPLAARYSLLQPAALAMHVERLRVLSWLLRRHGPADIAKARIVEVGCGSGGNLLDFLRFGASAEHLTGIELVPERHDQARQRLPGGVTLIEGDACASRVAARIAPESMDLVCQFTVFSSLLDDAFQQRLADTMWSWVRPGGAVLWYDFTVDNPNNPDVRGVPLKRVRALFPAAQLLAARRVTLAPPLARAACALHPALYGWLHAVPWLRTHRLVWLRKT